MEIYIETWGEGLTFSSMLEVFGSVSCIAVPACAESTLVDEGVSEACAGCFGDFVSCAVASCLTICLAELEENSLDYVECLECIRGDCEDDLITSLPIRCVESP